MARAKKPKQFTPQQTYYLFHHIHNLGFKCLPRLAEKLNAEEWEIKLAFEKELERREKVRKNANS